MVTMQTPDVWVTSFVEATEVLQLNDGLVQAGYDEAKDSIFGGVLLTLDGDVHRTRRRIEQGLFTPRAVRWIDATLVPALITTEIGEQTRPSLIDLVTFSRRITTRLAAWLVGLGELNSPDSVDELSGLMSAMHSGVTVRWSTRPHAEVLAEADDAKRFYARRWFEPALALKREGGSGGASQSPRPEEPPTLLDVLLTHEDELHFSDEQYLRESVHFFIAAAHTASADVAATGRVLSGMLRHFKLEGDGPCIDWDQVATKADPLGAQRASWVGPSRHMRWENEVIVLGFGKHGGAAVHDLAAGPDRSFLRWVVDKDFPVHVTEVCKAALDLPGEQFLAWARERYGQPAPTSAPPFAK